MSRKAGYTKNEGYMINELRRLHSRWEPKKQCITNSRIGRNQYKCALCPKVCRWQDIKADHIEPVIDPVVGFVDIPTYCARLFVEVEGYQAVCIDCHQIKTNAENALRTEHKSWKHLRV